MTAQLKAKLKTVLKCMFKGCEHLPITCNIKIVMSSSEFLVIV